MSGNRARLSRQNRHAGMKVQRQEVERGMNDRPPTMLMLAATRRRLSAAGRNTGAMRHSNEAPHARRYRSKARQERRRRAEA